jgi:hypothetical protein
MTRTIAAALFALPLLAASLPAFAQCAMPAPEPKTSAAPAEPTVQPG